MAAFDAAREFESSMDGKYVNGVDIIRVNDAGRIIEFRVMIRPEQAVNAVHRLRGAELDDLGVSGDDLLGVAERGRAGDVVGMADERRDGGSEVDGGDRLATLRVYESQLSSGC